VNLRLSDSQPSVNPEYVEIFLRRKFRAISSRCFWIVKWKFTREWWRLKWVTALDFDHWADSINARADLAEIVADLIRASVKDINSFRFPSRDSAQLAGWDGRLDSSGAPPYVPQGPSAWGLGTASDFRTKANEDYAERTKNPRGVNGEEATFIFVTPRRWTSTNPTIDEWIKDF
jgi:hypothetical protein